MFLHALILASVALAAPSIDVTPKLIVWECPPGFKYPIMECKPQETAYPPQHLEMTDVGDGFWIAGWKDTAPGVLQGYGAMDFMIYPNDKGVVKLSLMIGAGFDADTDRNPQAFFETSPSEFPSWFLMTGEKRVDGAHEILTTLEYADLKYTP